MPLLQGMAHLHLPFGLLISLLMRLAQAFAFSGASRPTIAIWVGA